MFKCCYLNNAKLIEITSNAIIQMHKNYNQAVNLLFF